MNLDHSATLSPRLRTELPGGECACASRRGTAAFDPAQRLSTHRTSRGHVVYFRCYCGRVGLTLIRLQHRGVDRPGVISP
jgi:hypothetical protein